MAECLWQLGMQPLIAADHCRGWIASGSQEDIFRAERNSDAVLAVNARESYDKRKFIDEVEKARYSLPTVAFVETGVRIIELLSTGCPIVSFRFGNHTALCGTVADTIRMEIRTARAVRIVEEPQELRRSNLG